MHWGRNLYAIQSLAMGALHWILRADPSLDCRIGDSFRMEWHLEVAPMKHRFTIRDLFWLTLLAAISRSRWLG